MGGLSSLGFQLAFGLAFVFVTALGSIDDAEIPKEGRKLFLEAKPEARSFTDGRFALVLGWTV